MGGPWKSRGFDPVAWRPPAARLESQADAASAHGSRDYVIGIVIGYLASVVTSIAIMLTQMKHGWQVPTGAAGPDGVAVTGRPALPTPAAAFPRASACAIPSRPSLALTAPDGASRSSNGPHIMPIYEYHCADCRRRVSLLVMRISDPGTARCPRCGGEHLTR